VDGVIGLYLWMKPASAALRFRPLTVRKCSNSLLRRDCCIIHLVYEGAILPGITEVTVS